MVSFGNASGAVPAFEIAILMQKGSLFLTRPTAQHYVGERPDFEAACRELLEAVGSGKVKVEVNRRYPLKDAGRAHEDLVARRTTGSSVLVP